MLVVLEREKLGPVLAKEQGQERFCWHCHRLFQKQQFKPLSNKDWRFVRYWHPELEEWICSMRYTNGQKYGCLGVTTTHLKAFKIRCEDCHVLYAKRWTTLGNTSLERINDSNLTLDRIICHNCYQKRSMSLHRKASRKDKGKAGIDGSGEIVLRIRATIHKLSGCLPGKSGQVKT
ncbi:unnamed protein product [Penicillium nalgiovense]|nr:unnamed protein product [Penicillium nalgiovense]